MSQPGSSLTDAAVGQSVARMLAPASEPLSPVLRGRSLDRRFDVLEVPLGSMRDSAQAVEGTINDVFLAGVGGGLHDSTDGSATRCRAVRVTMPINLRREGIRPGEIASRRCDSSCPSTTPIPRSVLGSPAPSHASGAGAGGRLHFCARGPSRPSSPAGARAGLRSHVEERRHRSGRRPRVPRPAYLGGASSGSGGSRRRPGRPCPSRSCPTSYILVASASCWISPWSRTALVGSVLPDSFDEVSAIGTKNVAPSAWTAS